MALSVVIILRITATMTTFGFFPVASRRSWNALSPGFQLLGVWSRSVGASAMLILHSGRQYGPGTSWQRHDHARHPSCDTAIEGSAQRLGRAIWIEPEDGREVA